MNRRQFLTFGMPPAARVLPQLSSVGRKSSLSERELASRFLNQATFGPTLAEIDEVVSIGYEAWIDQQFAQPRTETLTYLFDVLASQFNLGGEDEEGESLEGQPFFRSAWWQALMTNPDQLRQRVANALSQIMVISTRPDELEDLGTAIASYHDMLLRNAFGNFRDLLYDVTLHPAMGFYLSHAGNQKADPSINRYPDENYAREIMQLFSIGLFELNNDGTRKKDSSGNDIPTYDNSVIREFAKIFTGMTYTTEEGTDGIDEDFHDIFLYPDTCRVPMAMFEQFHEPGEKRLLNGQVVPAGQTGLQDVRDAIDNLFNHPNVGPFIGRLLIQRLVKSNPSHAYIGRVADAFNDNGSGVRGDMRAVIKTILLDDEARNPIFIADNTHGMLREPFIRYTQLCRSLEARNENGENLFYNSAYEAEESFGQVPYLSPSVFNFYMPDYKPLGPLLDGDIDAPEFQITTSVSTIKYFNFMERVILDDVLMDLVGLEAEDPDEELTSNIPPISNVGLNLDPYMAMDGNVTAVVARLNLILTYGSMSDDMLAIISQAVTDLHDSDEDWEEAVRFAILLFMTCPEYAILK